MFLSSDTSAIEAARLNRRCIGVELKPDLVKSVLQLLSCTRILGSLPFRGLPFNPLQNHGQVGSYGFLDYLSAFSC